MLRTDVSSCSRTRYAAVLFAVTLCAALSAAPASVRAQDAGKQNGASPAKSDAVATWRAARKFTIPRLVAHAAWCSDQKLRGERDRAYAGLLRLTPDHKRARRVLKYTRGKDGNWRRRSYRAPSLTTDDERGADVARRLSKAAVALRASVAALRSDTQVPVATREAAVRELAQIIYSDAKVRAWNGEVLLGTQWVLQETAVALKEGKALRTAILKAFAEQPHPDAAEVQDDDKPYVARFAQGAQNNFVRVLAMRGAATSVESARVFAAAHTAFTRAIGAEPIPTVRPRLFLFNSKTDGLRALGNHPSVNPAYLKWAGGLTSAWTPSGAMVFVWAADRPRRTEWCLRQALQLHLRTTLKINEKRGWAYEGVGHWMSGAMLGTHHSWYVRRDGYGNSAGSRDARLAQLQEPNAGWMKVGASLAKSKEWPDLRVMLGRGINTMSVDELLASYLLARFLIEGRPGQVHDVLTDVGAGVAPDAWCERRLGVSLPTLDRRLRRWVGEMTARGRRSDRGR